MKLRHRYLIAGIGWAMLLGPAIALALFSFAAGASWLWLFGDASWPEATQWVLPLIGLAGGFCAAALSIMICHRYGQRRERRAFVDLHREQRRVLLLTLTPLVLVLFVGVMLWKQGSEYSDAMNSASKREAYFAELVATRHKITSIFIEEDTGGTYHGTVQVVGHRKGRYQMRWWVTDTNFGKVLMSGNRPLMLQEGQQQFDLVFEFEKLAHAYRDEVLSGGGVLVEEPFELTVTLDPALDPAEYEAMPPGERNRVELGRSALRVRRAARFPVRFIVQRDGEIQK